MLCWSGNTAGSPAHSSFRRHERWKREKCMHAGFGPVSVCWKSSSSLLCLASVCVSSTGISASRLLGFCSSIACGNAGRCELTVAGIRYVRRF